MNEIYLQSNNPAAKLIHMFPSHVAFPLLFTVPGIFSVSISSILTRIPFWSRKPTIIFGTPRRKDWIQNFISLRSKARRSRSDWGLTEVLSSTQLMRVVGGSGLMSQTGKGLSDAQEEVRETYRRRLHRRELECFYRIQCGRSIHIGRDY